MKTAIVFLFALIFDATVLNSQTDNGVPASELKEWQEVWNPTTGSAWRTKTDERTGETVSYNPFTSEIWRNRATGKAEAVLRETWKDDGVADAKQKAGEMLSATPTPEPTATPEASETPTPAATPEATEIVFNDVQEARPPFTILVKRVPDEEYTVRLYDGGTLVLSKDFNRDIQEYETFVDDYVPQSSDVYLLVTWTYDRPGGSPEDKSDVWISINGNELHYNQDNGLDWRGGIYGATIKIKLQLP